ncbi:bactofilin family protein [Dethiothermospora halolimnae]|uniref:bactofilin family protein n=1 Tax=Dethiothermospora halolimnae TaxID=3114390 RepID=UPI003CCBACDF
MFNKNNIKTEKMDTIIGKNTKIDGKITLDGTIKIDGQVIGDINVNGDIIIGETGKIDGNIESNNTIVSGQINGNVTCSNQLRITNTGEIFGDIKTDSLIVDESGKFEGNCKMNTSTKDKKTIKFNSKDVKKEV